ncbi:MAG TPA: hypothetical protein PKD53_09490 [Chloroflexaceae bacterium]|nr:hypothetical protein [Chloroflexaceae bacterium]
MAHSKPPSRGRRARGRVAGDAAPMAIPSEPAIWLAAVAIVALSLAPVGLMALLRPGSAASSWLLATAFYLPCLIFAAMALYFGRATPVKARLVAAGLAVGGLAFAVWGGLVDYGQRAVTLVETELEGSAGLPPGAAPPARELSFAVEHPGVEHTLHFWPVAGPLGAGGTAVVRVELRDAGGATLLALEERFEPRARSDGPDRWGSASARFTPGRGGGYTLLVTPVTHGIPRVHVRIEDPLKRDGERMPGY